MRKMESRLVTYAGLFLLGIGSLTCNGYKKTEIPKIEDYQRKSVDFRAKANGYASTELLDTDGDGGVDTIRSNGDCFFAPGYSLQCKGAKNVYPIGASVAKSATEAKRHLNDVDFELAKSKANGNVKIEEK